MRIDLKSDPHKFIQISPPKRSDGFLLIEKYEQGISKNRQCGGLKLNVADVLPVFITALFSCGITCGEMLAEIWSQKDGLDPEMVESLMRR